MTDLLPSFSDIELLRPWVLWLLIPAVALFIAGLIRRISSPLSLIFRLVAFSLLIGALADPARTHTSSGKEFSVLFDLSYSISDAGRAALSERLATFLAAIPNGERTQSAIRVTGFGRNSATDRLDITSVPSADEIRHFVTKLHDDVDTGETNLGGVIQTAISQGDSSSLLLLSDGYETTGDAKQVARMAAAKGDRVFPLIPEDESPFRDAELSLSLLEAPVTLNAGEAGEIRASVQNSFTSPREGDVEIWLDDKRISREHVKVSGGEEKLVTIKTPVAEGGLHRLRAVVIPTGQEAKKSERYRWISVKSKSKILLLSGAAEDARVLKELLGLGGFSLESIVADGRTSIPTNFENISAVVLNNIAVRQLPHGFLEKLKSYVSSGGGALLLGGERSFGLGGYIDTPLEEISPLKFVPPTTTKRRLNSAVVLLIDKSRSMSYQGKMTSAKAAALSAIQTLKDDDFVSVISFDADPFMVLPLKPVPDARIMVSDRLRHLTPVGRTILHPAIGLAQRTLERANASRKHVILLTDGEFPYEENSLILNAVQRLQGAGITLSSVAVGVEADVPLLKTLAGYGKGAFYQTVDPTRLPEIFIQDIKVATGEKTMREQQDFPVGVGPSGLSTVSVSQYPILRGFVETLPKKGSRLELVTRKDQTVFPILGSWEYGSGHVVAFTSDANGRWSQPWLRWENFARFWMQAVESVKQKGGNKTGDIDFDLRFAVDGKRIVFDLPIYDDKLATHAPPRITAQVKEPGGEQTQVIFQAVKKGRFQATIENGRPGDYRLDITYGQTRLPPLAVTIQGDSFGERPGRGLDVQNLSALAHLSGGVINPTPAQVGNVERTTTEREHLFLPLVIAAFIVLLLEAFIREMGLNVIFRRGIKRIKESGGQKTPTYERKAELFL